MSRLQVKAGPAAFAPFLGGWVTFVGWDDGAETLGLFVLVKLDYFEAFDIGPGFCLAIDAPKGRAQ